MKLDIWRKWCRQNSLLRTESLGNRVYVSNGSTTYQPHGPGKSLNFLESYVPHRWDYLSHRIEFYKGPFKLSSSVKGYYPSRLLKVNFAMITLHLSLKCRQPTSCLLKTSFFLFQRKQETGAKGKGKRKAERISTVRKCYRPQIFFPIYLRGVILSSLTV